MSYVITSEAFREYAYEHGEPDRTELSEGNEEAFELYYFLASAGEAVTEDKVLAGVIKDKLTGYGFDTTVAKK